MQKLLINCTHFSQVEDKTTNVCRLDEILHGWDEPFDNPELLDALFCLIERSPTAELGCPGPVVYLIERIPGYEKRLLESINSTPTVMTVWMVDRILNSAISEADRTKFLSQLEGIATSKNTDPDSMHWALECLAEKKPKT